MLFSIFLTRRYLETSLSNLCEEQTIAIFLITLRVANQSATPNITIISGSASSIRFRSRGRSTSCNGVILDGHPTSSMNSYGESRGELGVEIDTSIDLQHDG